MTTTSFLSTALAYAAHGWPIHPLKPGQKIPATTHGSKDATAEPSRIERWWAATPSANIGIATGHGFFVVDLDGPAAALWAESVELPDTLTCATGKGRHLYYRLPSGVVISNSAGQISEGVDIRGVGGYVVAPPSLHPSGAVYQWEDVEGIPTKSAMAPAPTWLVEQIKTKARNPFVLPASIPEGERHTTLFRYASSLRARGVSEQEIWRLVSDAARRCTPPFPQRDVDVTVAWVLDNYAAPSQTSAAPAQTSAPPAAPSPTSAAPTEPTTPPPTSPSPKLKPNDLAQQILRDHRFVNVDGFLYEYGLTHWQQITTERLKSIAAERDGESWTTQRRRAEIADFIRVSTYRRQQQWRLLEPFEIAVGNGVVDIRSASLRPHRSEDYLQACVPIPLNPSAQCPTLMRCLDTYFGRDDDGEAKSLALQEFFGYCLMSHARYKKALLCYGESNCGKSTIPFLLRELVGPANMCAVSVEDMDDPRKRAPLRGKLINALTELPTDAMIADGGFKTLVSTEEPIQFDEKYMPSIMDVPIAKHVIVTNALPTINDRSKGTFNRLLLVQFRHVIPETDQNKRVWDELRAEIEGVLLWAIEGAQRLYRNDGRFTSVGGTEMRSYIASQNPVVAFLAERAERIEAHEKGVFLHELREAFALWYGQKVRPQWFAALLRGAEVEVSDVRESVVGNRGFRVMGWRLQ